MYHKMGVEPDAFPVFDKTIVNGPGTLEAYAILKTGATSGHDANFDIAWNYAKFLVDGDGVPVERYASEDDPRVAEDEIRRLLGLDDKAAAASAA